MTISYMQIKDPTTGQISTVVVETANVDPSQIANTASGNATTTEVSKEMSTNDFSILKQTLESLSSACCAGC
jgi:hypothetical protein